MSQSFAWAWEGPETQQRLFWRCGSSQAGGTKWTGLKASSSLDESRSQELPWARCSTWHSASWDLVRFWWCPFSGLPCAWPWLRGCAQGNLIHYLCPWGSHKSPRAKAEP